MLNLHNTLMHSIHQEYQYSEKPNHELRGKLIMQCYTQCDGVALVTLRAFEAAMHKLPKRGTRRGELTKSEDVTL